MSENNNIRTVEDILNLETGENINASELLDKLDEDDIVLLRRKLRTANREDNPIFVCAECSTKLELRCNNRSWESRGKNFYFFKHYKDNKECSIKTNSHLPVGVLLARKYENVKESAPHIDLKNRLGYILEQFHSPDKINVDNKFYFDKSGNGEKRKPDVFALIDDREYVFEIQLNTTFLSVIEEREAFYESNNVSIIWIFKHFQIEEESQRLTQKDIYIPNRLNAFVLDEEMIELSIQKKRLHFKVFYKTFYVTNGDITNQWNCEIITLEDLRYADGFKPYFYDSFADKNKAKQELDRIREEKRLEKIQLDRIRWIERERQIEEERLNQRKKSKGKMLLETLQLEMSSLEKKQSRINESKKEFELKTDKLQTENQEISQILKDIHELTERTFNYLKNCNLSSWGYIPSSLTCYYDISYIKDKYCERIGVFESTKKDISIQLEKEILPKKNFISGFSYREIGGVRYSVIPMEKKFAMLTEKFSEEVKVIDTKDLGTIFESSCIYDLTDLSLFHRYIRINDNSKTFLIDMTSRESEIILMETELLVKLEQITKEENTCKHQLQEDIIKLLEETLSKNAAFIIKTQENVDTLSSDILDSLGRREILSNRTMRCKQYLNNL